ncbi:Bax inhibitor-1/YccA family membrane protein [Corynebacterium liangguodongii]|uniref:Uncharacterized protein n=1 Tax=Corynebacterium liangguodongii TaxID=2079535 RepID=A0A2S0WD84_9CORY|nr:Bax inhibitor-1/YccA family protein [Corynebacterium liangguodongii]AWB83728.1 hypothetical protein C3E79_03860 [Corynebacterium liangguodongii]PWB99462.1 hypothetical protein DF219_05935 [Corynebacterium liangguodongii]
MRSNNPVLSQLPQAGSEAGYGYQQNYQPSTRRPMTVDDVVTKTGITLAVIVACAVANTAIALTGNPGLTSILTFVGAIGGFITVLVHSFGKNFGSRTVTLIYAVFEGLFVGGFSVVMSGWVIGNANAGAMIAQAILGTLGVFLGMLYVYKTGAVKVTPRFNRILTGAIFGVAIMALGNLVLFLFTGMNPLRDGGPLAIIFGIVCIILAALSFLQDFDLADKLVRTGAPSEMAWGVALGLAVTLVWLYTEILHLLSQAQRD